MEQETAQPPQRIARLVLVTPDGNVVGQLPPFPVEWPWWPEAESVVRTARERHGIDVVILRLLSTARERLHGGEVTYLAEVAAPVPVEPWQGLLDTHPLRQAYAKPGGPAADLAWAAAVLVERGMAADGRPTQIRSWNLSSIWRIPVGGRAVWLKVVPPFFAHEGAVLEALADWPVPRLIGREDGRVLLAEAPGEDMYEAALPRLLDMVTLLVGLQAAWIGRTGELLALGLPDWRGPALAAAIGKVIRRTRLARSAGEIALLDRFVGELPRRFAEVASCGLPDTLVHGDFHPGNFRGTAQELTLLDWGDSGIGHPMLDQSAFLDRVAAGQVPAIREHWTSAWLALSPGSDPARAATLLAPIAAARQAVIYQRFLDNIEPSEQVYHRHDPADWLRRTATLLGEGS